jgi:hypothetical protein
MHHADYLPRHYPVCIAPVADQNDFKSGEIDMEHALAKWDGDIAKGYISAEVDHPLYDRTLFASAEKLQRCPDRRWFYSVDVLEIDERLPDIDGVPQRVLPRSVACGIVDSGDEAVAGAEGAIRRIIGGIGTV